MMAQGMFRIRGTNMAGVEALSAETDHAFCKHSHDQFGIGVVLCGAQTSASGRGQVEAMAGDLISVNPGEVHDGRPIGGSGRRWEMLYFAPEIILAVAADIHPESARQELEFPVLRDRDAVSIFRQLHASALSHRPGDGLACESLLLALVDRLMPGQVLGRSHVPVAGLRRAIGQIDDMPTRDWTLADLAKTAGLSRFQVLRGFAATTGLTPHAYLMQRRTDLARWLIRRAMPLAEAAAASGFADQSHMTRVFARKYGITPGAYAAAIG
jgi:AraC-like DNA-binding protein